MSISKSFTKLTSTERETLKSKSAYTLPDNPSDKSFSASQIKSRMYEPVLMLFDWIKDMGDEVDDIFDNFAEYYTKTDADTLLAGKVDKSTSQSVVYGTDAQGAQKVYDLDVGNALGDVVARNESGQINVPQTPTDNLHATSKKYVDDAIASAPFSNDKEDKANKVTTISASSTDTQYPSAKCVYNENKATREIAEGKTQTFAVNPTTEGNEALQGSTDTITLTSFTDIDGNAITVSNLHRGDEIFTLNVNDVKYKDWWLIDPSTGTWGLLDADVPDLSGFATINTDQTIECVKTFKGSTSTTLPIVFANDYSSSTFAMGKNNDWFYIRDTGVRMAMNSGQTIFYQKLYPNVSDTYDLGQIGNQWKDFYLGGKAYFINNDTFIYTDSSQRLVLSNNSDRLKITRSGDIQFVANAVPLITNQYDLGNSSLNWKDLYLSGTQYMSSTGKIDFSDNYSIRRNSTDIVVACDNNSAFAFRSGTNFTYGNLLPTANNSKDLGSSTLAFKDLYLGGYTFFFNGGNYWGMTATNSGHFRINKNGSDVLEIRNNIIYPISSNSVSLGTNAQLFRNIFVANEISDGTNAIKVAKIANKDNFVKISQADYDALVSGDEVDEDTFYFIEEE